MEGVCGACSHSKCLLEITTAQYGHVGNPVCQELQLFFGLPQKIKENNLRSDS